MHLILRSWPQYSSKSKLIRSKKNENERGAEANQCASFGMQDAQSMEYRGTFSGVYIGMGNLEGISKVLCRRICGITDSTLPCNVTNMFCSTVTTFLQPSGEMNLQMSKRTLIAVSAGHLYQFLSDYQNPRLFYPNQVTPTSVFYPGQSKLPPKIP